MCLKGKFQPKPSTPNPKPQTPSSLFVGNKVPLTRLAGDSGTEPLKEMGGIWVQGLEFKQIWLKTNAQHACCGSPLGFRGQTLRFWVTFGLYWA